MTAPVRAGCLAAVILSVSCTTPHPSTTASAPQRARPAAAVPAGEKQLMSIGATDRPITLVGEPVEVPVPIDEATCRAALASPGSHRVLVALTDVWSEVTPGVIYAVLVNLPQDPTPEVQQSHRVGTIALYTPAPMPEPGVRMSFDMTQALAQDETLMPAACDDMRVSLRPRSSVPSGRSDDELADQQETPRSHADRPLRVGRIEVFIASTHEPAEQRHQPLRVVRPRLPN